MSAGDIEDEDRRAAASEDAGSEVGGSRSLRVVRLSAREDRSAAFASASIAIKGTCDMAVVLFHSFGEIVF